LNISVKASKKIKISLLIKKMPRKMSLPTFINLLQVDNINDFSSDEFIMNPGANI